MAGAGIARVAIESITPNPRQPRKEMNPQELAELAESVRTHGVLQPVIVTPAAQPGQYILIAGERRWRRLCGVRRPAVRGEGSAHAAEGVAFAA